MLKRLIGDILDEQIDTIENEPLPNHFKNTDLPHALGSHQHDLVSQLKDLLNDENYGSLIDLEKLAKLAVTSVYKNYYLYLNDTGVVVAGYGDTEYYPAYVHYECYGVILGKFVYDKKEEQKISVDNTSHIKPFATTSMVNTFQLGISPDLFDYIRDELKGSLLELCESIKKELGVNDIPNIDKHISDTIQAHTDKWLNHALEAHAWPLQRVVGSLPVDEMAELAETLIMLQSLKEKVTKPTESVGGPIDVAIISKGDGFIWTKRKHYFDPKLNYRFLSRHHLTHA